MEFKKVAGLWNPVKAGEEIQGKIIGIQEEGGNYKNRVYTLETETEIKDVFGSTVLDKKLENIGLINQHIKIVFLGKKQGKKEYKDFDVYKGVIQSA